MHKTRKALAVLLATLSLGGQNAYASMIGSPMALGGVVEQIRFSEPSLAPMAYIKFCLRYSNECKPRPRKIIFRGGSVRMTRERMQQLIEVNASVNRKITPMRNEKGILGEEWVIAPTRGDCNDYAVTKRHELLARGWPMRNLLLSEVITSWGEHHLILVVRTTTGDIILDNMNAQIRPWSKANYRWVRMQTPNNPDYWASIASVGV